MTSLSVINTIGYGYLSFNIRTTRLRSDILSHRSMQINKKATERENTAPFMPNSTIDQIMNTALKISAGMAGL